MGVDAAAGLSALAVVVMLGCGGEDGRPGGSEPEPDTEDDCPLGTWPEDGGCVVAGLPPEPACAPGSGLDAIGACVEAGIPPGACGAGFVHDGARGCDAIMPAAACAKGLIAVPGDRACREVAPCGAAPWGNIVVATNTQYVDQSYAGGASDGSASDPWTTVQEGIDNAAPGAVVAIAAGQYVENLTIGGKPVHLWGVCPSQVEVVGAATGSGAIFVSNGAANTVIEGVGVTGNDIGVLISGSQDVLLDRVWVHDTQARAINVEGGLGPTSVTVRDALIEHSMQFAIMVISATLTVERVAVRDVPANQFGGIAVWSYNGTQGNYGQQHDASDATIRGSLIERTPMGVYVSDSVTTIEDTLIRDTTGTELAVIVRPPPQVDCSRAPAQATLRRSVIEGVKPGGVAGFGSVIDIEHVVVRDIIADSVLGAAGIAMAPAREDGVVICDGSLRPSATVRASLISGCPGRGIQLNATDATVDRVAALDTTIGVVVANAPCFGDESDPNCEPWLAPQARANVAVLSSHVEANRGIGVFVDGSDARIEGTWVRDTIPYADDTFGRGIHAQSSVLSAVMEIRGSLVEGSAETGIALVGADMTVHSSVVRNTVGNVSGFFGDGVIAFAFGKPANATIMSSRIEESGRSALASFGATVAVGGNVFACAPIDINVETYEGQPYVTNNLGGNGCGCPDIDDCKAQSANLTPPAPLNP